MEGADKADAYNGWNQSPPQKQTVPLKISPSAVVFLALVPRTKTVYEFAWYHWRDHYLGHALHKKKGTNGYECQRLEDSDLRVFHPSNTCTRPVEHANPTSGPSSSIKKGYISEIFEMGFPCLGTRQEMGTKCATLVYSAVPGSHGYELFAIQARLKLERKRMSFS
ncbi:hypothetical protein TWF706_001906 [Orbilia oligospora]|nr:hypothetical protein TWF706_001906 [Orbilia oligospora]